MQSLTQSIATLTDHQNVTQARLDTLTRALAGPHLPNPNLANPTTNSQAPPDAPIAPPIAHQQASLPPMALANINLP